MLRDGEDMIVEGVELGQGGAVLSSRFFYALPLISMPFIPWVFQRGFVIAAVEKRNDSSVPQAMEKSREIASDVLQLGI